MLEPLAADHAVEFTRRPSLGEVREYPDLLDVDLWEMALYTSSQPHIAEAYLQEPLCGAATGKLPHFVELWIFRV